MSYDLQLSQTCEHRVTEEALFVSSDDRKTVIPLRPISAASSVSVFLNHAIGVPSSGTLLPAKTSGTRRAPFTITSTTNILAISVDQGPVQTVTVPLANKMGAQKLASVLSGLFADLNFSVVNDRIAIATKDKGPQKSFRIDSTSTAASVFGFTVDQEFRGQTSVPGWTVVTDPNTRADRPTRLVVFDQPLRSGSDFVELSYVTLREECRRCGGIGVENDWRYNVNGQIVTVQDDDLLVQELQKNFYTIRGSNQFHTWYGTLLIESIGKKIAASGFARNLVVSDLNQAFNSWQSIKRQQEEDVGQFVSDREFPYRLLGVDLEQSSQDPTVVFITVTVQNRSNDPIQLTRGLKLPQALELTV